MTKPNRGKGVGNLLVAQLLLGILIVVAQAYYPTNPRATLVAIYLFILGILYFSWKGLKGLWK